MKMSKIRSNIFLDSLNIILTIASKDIVDALKNRTVVSMIIMLSVILLMPKMLPWIFEQPELVLPVYDAGSASLQADLQQVPGISVQSMRSEDEMAAVLCSGVYPQIGLRIPADFDALLTADGQVALPGYVCWSKRHQVLALRTQLEEMLSMSLGYPVNIELEGNYAYPPESGLGLNMATINSVLMILMMGIILVPSLLLDEKETRTMQALLVSPARIGQVVLGKALTGAFYILVTAVLLFGISWVEVIHWDLVMLFVIGGGVFSVAVGLLLGSFFEKQQDIVGWMSALLLLLISAIFVRMFGLEVPLLVEKILSWVPSVALSEICRAAFSKTVDSPQVLANLGIVLVVSLPLYAVVVWKVHRSDR
jgi:ABC-2 type transport system permease protein